MIERLTDELSGWIQRRDLYFNALAEYFMNNVNGWESDSLIALYQSDDRLSSRYLLAQYYLNRHYYTQANNTLENIPSSFDLNNRQTYFYDKCLELGEILPELFTDTTGYLIPDSTKTIALEQLAEEGQYLPGAWARNILVSCGLLNYQEPIVFSNQLKSSRINRNYGGKSRINVSEFKIFPNPAKDYIIVDCHRENSYDKAYIDIIDVKGKKIQSVSLLHSGSQQIISLTNLLSGCYFVRINYNGIVKETCKLVVIR